MYKRYYGNFNMDIESYMKQIRQDPRFYTNNERKRKGLAMRRKGVTRGIDVDITSLYPKIIKR